MILTAGTEEQQHEDSSRAIILRETQAREASEPNTSEIQVRAHTDTDTVNLLAQIAALKEELAKSQAEAQAFKA